MLHTLQPRFTQQPMTANNLTEPVGPWHHPLQCYTISGIFNAFSTLDILPGYLHCHNF